jgi:GTP-binding protein HflX
LSEPRHRAEERGWAAAPARRAAVIYPEIPGLSQKHRSPDARLEEAVGLARAIDLDVVHAESVRLTKPVPATLLGGGVVERLHGQCEALGVEVVIVDAALSPVQQRNLETAIGTKVIDRTGLILEIFGARAQTHEGRLQVELAALSFQRSRLVRSWTHLERQRGGLGFVGGPGESQLEIDRRLIDERIGRLKKELEQVARTRGLHRKSRERVPYPVVALVGYTNAGKSTLFNRLTDATVMAKDMLFATLDPTMRKLSLPSGRTAILSDTVGFISDLPTDLVAAFRATLEEVRAADVLIHVRDIAAPDSDVEKADVEQVLASLDIDPQTQVIEVWNKTDRLPAADRTALIQRAAAARTAEDEADAYPLSAAAGDGIDAFLGAVDAALSRHRETRVLRLSAADGAALAWLHRHGDVLGHDEADEGATAEVRVALDPADWERFARQFGATAESGKTAG